MYEMDSSSSLEDLMDPEQMEEAVATLQRSREFDEKKARRERIVIELVRSYVGPYLIQNPTADIQDVLENVQLLTNGLEEAI